MSETRGDQRLLGVGVVAVQAALLLAFFLAPKRHDWPVPGWLATAGSAAVIAGMAILLVAAANLGRSLTALPNPAARATLQTGHVARRFAGYEDYARRTPRFVPLISRRRGGRRRRCPRRGGR